MKTVQRYIKKKETFITNTKKDSHVRKTKVYIKEKHEIITHVEEQFGKLHGE